MVRWAGLVGGQRLNLCILPLPRSLPHLTTCRVTHVPSRLPTDVNDDSYAAASVIPAGLFSESVVRHYARRI